MCGLDVVRRMDKTREKKILKYDYKQKNKTREGDRKRLKSTTRRRRIRRENDTPYVRVP